MKSRFIPEVSGVANMFTYLCLLFVISVSLSNSLVLNEGNRNSVEYLTKHFFENLKNDPRLADQELTRSSKRYVDTQVKNYINMVTKKDSHVDHSVSRRSLPIDDMESFSKDNIGIYKLESVAPLYRIGNGIVIKLMLFKQNSGWYAGSLEADKRFQLANKLVIYKEEDTRFSMIQSKIINGGFQIETHTVQGFTYIVVAENHGHNNVNKTHTIYKFHNNEELEIIQTLDIPYSTSTVIWTQQEEIFMAISQQINYGSYEMYTPIYKWKGRHFDIIHYIKTYSPRRITPFTIENSHYLAVANFQDDKNNTNINSEIFKYDIHSEEFASHQKLGTHGAFDVKYFCFTYKHFKDTFLVFANHLDDSSYETNSILYKYVDDYFLPFQSFEVNAPTEWLPAVGPNGEFVLLVACKFDGIKLYQYDGWKFIQSSVVYDDEAFSKGITSMRHYIFCSQLVVVITKENDTGNMVNIFELKFTHQNLLRKFHNDMFAWCTNALETTEKSRLLGMRETVAEENETIKNQSEDKNREKRHNEKLKRIESELNEQLDILQDMEDSVHNTLQSPEVNVIEHDIYADSIIANTDLLIPSLNTSEMNNYEVEQFFKKIIPLKVGFTTEQPLHFNTIKLENGDHFLSSINGHSANTMLRRSDNINLRELNIVGPVVFEKGIDIKGTVNGIRVTSQNILLNNGDQNLGPLGISDVETEKLRTTSINKLKIGETEMTGLPKTETIEDLTVKKLIIKDYLNDIDIAILNKWALKTHGNQTISEEYVFDNLHVRNLNIRGLLSGKEVLKELVRIDEGTYFIPHDVQFKNTFNAKNITVLNSLNQIPVTQGKLDILLTNTNVEQHITGTKDLDSIMMLNSFNMQAALPKEMKRMNPFISIDEEIVINGDYLIQGNTTVETILTALDVQDTDGSSSVQKLQKDGLRLAEEKIKIRPIFSQQMIVEDVFAEKINNVDMGTLIVGGTGEEIVIDGLKKVFTDLSITGTTQYIYANDINMQNLNFTILQTEGDQHLNGTYEFENVQTERLTSFETRFKDLEWEDMITINENREILGTTYLSSLQADKTTIQYLKLDGILNDKHFESMINDTAMKNQSYYFTGGKYFENILIDNLTVQTGINLNELPSVLKNEKYTMDGDVALFEPVIENIYFDGTCNEIAKDAFNKMWYLENDGEINGNMKFENIVVYGNTNIYSNKINNVDLTDLAENTVKIDEPHHFNSINFGTAVVAIQNINLAGDVVGLDLENVVDSESHETQIIHDEIIFNDDVNVDGAIYFKRLISGVNLEKLCAFSSENDINTKLIVNGSAFFAKGPAVQYLNNKSVQHLMENTWFKNKETAINGYVEFGNVYFEENILANFIAGIDFEYIKNNYLSKTRNQTILGHLAFMDNVLFNSGIEAQQASVGGEICGINLDEFVRTTILDGVDQVFEEPVFLENIYINNPTGLYTINNLDVEEDLVRYDKDNEIVGLKTCENVSIQILQINPEIRIQNVEIATFLQSVVLKEGAFRAEGKKYFLGRVNFQNGLSSPGLVNGYSIDDIMLKSIPQNITAIKNFVGKADSPMYFDNVLVEGLINDYLLDEELLNQVDIREDIVLETPVIFNGSLYSKNLHIKNTYQNTNISQLLKNITHFAAFNNYNENYGHLFNVSQKVDDSLKQQAYFLSHYKTVQVLPDVTTVIPIMINDEYNLAIIHPQNGTAITYWHWDDRKYMFNSYNAFEINLKPSFISRLKFEDIQYLYLEGTDNDDEFAGILAYHENGTTFVVKQVATEGSISISSLTIPDREEECMVMVYATSSSPNILCNMGADIYEYQNLDNYNVSQVITLAINETPYIILIAQETEDTEAVVNIWKYDKLTQKFYVDQTIFTIAPNSATATEYNGRYYLAISSGYVANAMHEEAIYIMRFENESQQFEQLQTIHLNSPKQVKFATLPSEELLLYTLTDSLTEPMIVFEYEGVSGFTRKLVTSGIQKTKNIRDFNTRDNRHFVLLEGRNEVQILEAVLKGEKYE